MKKKKRPPQEEKVPLEPKEQRFPAEDLDEDEQVIEEAAYAIGMNRGRDPSPKDRSEPWVEEETKASEDLD